MTITAQSIIKTAQGLLSDAEGVRWPAGDLIAHLNDGQRDMAALRPDQFAIAADFALSPGPRQILPAACNKLIDIPRNATGPAIRQVKREMLDAVDPLWYSKGGTLTVQHFMHDPREPSAFYVYPPAATGASVSLSYAAIPADVPAPSGRTSASVTGNISAPDALANALLHFVLFRAYASDTEMGNAALSAAHYQLYKAALSEDLATRQAVKPTTENPA